MPNADTDTDTADTTETRLSPREREVLRILWQIESGTVRDVLQRLRRTSPDLAYSTVKTFLHRLVDKGVVTCDRGSFAHVFTPIRSPHGAVAREAELLAERMGQSSFSVVRALVERTRFTDQQVAELKALVDDLLDEDR